MANKNEFKIITSMYNVAIGKAQRKIEESIEEAKREHGFENGSALTDLFRKHLNEAQKGIEPLYELNEYGCKVFVESENGGLSYDKKDALKMLKGIEIINTYIL